MSCLCTYDTLYKLCLFHHKNMPAAQNKQLCRQIYNAPVYYVHRIINSITISPQNYEKNTVSNNKMLLLISFDKT